MPQVHSEQGLQDAAALIDHLATADAPPQPPTGHVDHISFRAHGLREMRAHLRALGVPFAE
ncbi:VOC family protein, partial [Variovorax paradoxus]|uniref:VOC family protein n=1 Tax=Variovorax paradoxus TaxID=34073 RepID=UPI0038D133ED